MDLSFAETAALGSLAGFTIYLGLPLGRMRTIAGGAVPAAQTVSSPHQGMVARGAAAQEAEVSRREAAYLAQETEVARARALQRGLAIAVAIGLHNFAEGLAIGVSARAGEISLATVLIVGFALHNATEGFGIIGPLGNVRPSWRWLGLAGLIGGGPGFLGAVVGYHRTNQPLQLALYALP